jgi:hypothetical protein
MIVAFTDIPPTAIFAVFCLILGGIWNLFLREWWSKRCDLKKSRLALIGVLETVLATNSSSGNLNRPESMTIKPNSSGGHGAKTPFQKFHALASGLIRVPKAEIDRQAKEHRMAGKAKKRP